MTTQPDPRTRIDINALLARIPDAREAIDKNEIAANLRKLAMGDATIYWNLANPSDLTTMIHCAALQIELDAVRAELDDIKNKYETARAAERGWRLFGQAKSNVIFRNDAGEVAKMPLDLVRLFAAKRAFDGDIDARENTIVFSNQGKTIAQIPKTLFVCLEKILESSAWNSRISRRS